MEKTFPAILNYKLFGLYTELYFITEQEGALIHTKSVLTTKSPSERLID